MKSELELQTSKVIVELSENAGYFTACFFCCGTLGTPLAVLLDMAASGR